VKGFCDTHLHVFGDAARYPLDPRRNYTPALATLAAYRTAVMQACGVERAVLVQPSVYGTDNRCLLDALRDAAEAGLSLRAIVVPDAASSQSELEAMHALGARGIRLNQVNPQMLDVDAGFAMAARMRHRGWHLQVHVSIGQAGEAQLAALAERAHRVGIALVVDHMGRPGPGTIPRRLVALLATGRVWVKLSAPYRNSAEPAPAHGDLLPLVRALVAANPEQLLWGSDWPHTELSTPAPRIADLVELLAGWLPDTATRQKVSVANPARLYDF
jgi:predicted TIM-barrel fold metal-dependent hydrolase